MENMIRSIMAESHAPALKIPEPDRVADALKVLHANGITSAKAADDKTITIENGEVDKAYDILDRAIQKGMIAAKPIVSSAEAIKVDDHVEPIATGSDPTPPEHGHKIGEECETKKQDENETEINAGTIGKRSLVNRMENQLKKIDESQSFEKDEELDAMIAEATVEELEQLDELSKQTLTHYIKASSSSLVDKAASLGRSIVDPEVDAKKYSRQTNNRRRGIWRAASRLGEEAEQIDELSYKTLNAYSRKGREETKNALDNKIERRKKGLEMAKTKKVKMVAKAAFGEGVDPIETFLEQFTIQMINEAKGLRLIATHHSDCGKHCAKVYKDSEWGEHRVKYHVNGKHHEPADYHTGDVEDAHHTARSELKRLTKLNGALKEAVEAEDDLTWLEEEFEQLDELSKAVLGKYVSKASKEAAYYSHGLGMMKHSSVMNKQAGGRNSDVRKRAMSGNEKHINKRLKGIDTAVKKLTKEEAEEGTNPFQLDELSPATMTKYAVKAPSKIKREHQKSQDHEGKAHAVLHSTAPNKSIHDYSNHLDKAAQHSSKARIHSKALKKVTNKIAHKAMPAGVHEEAEQIDELSKNTLSRYTIKASASKVHHEKKAMRADDAQNEIGRWQHYKDSSPAEDRARPRMQKIMKHHDKKAVNRERGLDRAINHIAGLRSPKKTSIKEEAISEGKKQDVEKAEKLFRKHKEATAMYASIHKAAKQHRYVVDGLDHVYNNHRHELEYGDWEDMKPAVEKMLKDHGLQ
jgi:hypothetical protein